LQFTSNIQHSINDKQMPLPNKDTIGHEQVLLKRKKTKWQCSPVIFGLVAIGFMIVMYASLSTNGVPNTTMRLEERNALPTDKKEIIPIKPLLHEPILLQALQKSCLPQTNDHCKTFIPPNAGGKQRVALIAPPGDLTVQFLRVIQEVIEHATKKDDTVKIELLPTSHMAPYGYGKTHGLTRIIRVVPDPFVMGVTDTLLKSASLVQQDQQHSGESVSIRDSSITLQDLKTALRQQIRFHCRLSHVSAHTALWTIPSHQLTDTTMTDLVSQIQSFLGLAPHQEEEEDYNEGLTKSITTTISDMAAQFRIILDAGTSLLTNLQTLSSPAARNMDDLYHVLDQVLWDDMNRSQNLTAWPCESFWTVGDENAPLELSPITKRIAAAISPNCSAPFTSCFVKRDKCEAMGDGLCA
jgi:hypothetical protein